MCRAARFCHAAAHGGQVTAPLRLIQQVIRVWTSNGIPTADDGEVCGEPVQVRVPEGAEGSLLPWPAMSPAALLGSCSTMHTLLHRRHQTRGDCILPCSAYLLIVVTSLQVQGATSTSHAGAAGSALVGYVHVSVQADGCCRGRGTSASV